MFSWVETRFLLKIIATTLIVILLCALYLHTSRFEKAPLAMPKSQSLDLIPEGTRLSAPLIPAVSNILNLKYNTDTTSTKTATSVHFINFWAHWCAPCLTEIPKLDSLLADLPIKTHFVHMDDSTDATENAREFLKHIQPRAHSVIDPSIVNDLRQIFQISHLPSHVLIDKLGRIAWKFDGSIENQLDKIKELVLKLENESVQ